MIVRGDIVNHQIFQKIKKELGIISSKEPWIDEDNKWYNSDETQKEFIARSWCWNRYVELTKLTKIENNHKLYFSWGY